MTERQTVSPDHFYKQFDRYAPGLERHQAVCQHASMLLQRLYDTQAQFEQKLSRILRLLEDGKEVQAALLIVQLLEDGS